MVELILCSQMEFILRIQQFLLSVILVTIWLGQIQLYVRLMKLGIHSLHHAQRVMKFFIIYNQRELVIYIYSVHKSSQSNEMSDNNCLMISLNASKNCGGGSHEPWISPSWNCIILTGWRPDQKLCMTVHSKGMIIRHPHSCLQHSGSISNLINVIGRQFEHNG